MDDAIHFFTVELSIAREFLSPLTISDAFLA